MNGVQKFQIHRDDRSTDRLPAAHTCFNQLDLPAYEVRVRENKPFVNISFKHFHSDLRQAEELLAESHSGVLRRLWIRLERERALSIMNPKSLERSRWILDISLLLQHIYIQNKFKL